MISSTQFNNPAGRLLALLEKAGSLSSNQQTTLGQQLLRLFPDAKGVDDYFTFIHKATCIIALVEEIKLLLGIYDEGQLLLFNKAEKSLKGFANIVPLQQTWVSFINNWIRPSDLTALAFASLTLERQAPEPIVSSAEIDAIRVQLLDLETSVRDASIPFALKALIFESVSELTRALADYELRGSKGIDVALGTVLGRALLHSDLGVPSRPAHRSMDEADRVDSGEVLWQEQFWLVVSRIAQAIKTMSSVDGLLRIIEESHKALPRSASSEVQPTEPAKA